MTSKLDSYHILKEICIAMDYDLNTPKNGDFSPPKNGDIFTS